MPTPFVTLTALIPVTPVIPQVASGTSIISVDTTVLPYAILADINTSQIEVSAYNLLTYNKTPVVVNGQNQFTGFITINPTLGDTTVQILGRNYDPTASAWQPSIAYALGYRLVDPSGYVQIVTTAGTSGTSIPSFSMTLGLTTHDNGVVWTNLGFISVTPTLAFGILPYVSSSGALIGPPSGVSVYKAQNVCRIEWSQPTYAGIVGTSVLLSTDPAGLNPIYTQYGDVVPPTQLSRTVANVLSSTSTVSYDGTSGTQTTTTVDAVQQNSFNYIDVPQSDVGGADVFYAMLSTVIQDPATQAVFESQQSGPFTCGFVNLKLVALTDFLALQRKEDIAGRMISQINRNYPNLDLAPRSELRDLMIDPVAIELSNMSVREWFTRISESVSALSQVDNASGSGISDPFNSSPVKQQISRAYGLNATDTQTFINNQFDILGERAGESRIGATGSVVQVTFYTYVLPTTTVTFTQGLIVSTVADSQTPALNFITTGSASLTPASASIYFDPINDWWAVSVPASCQSTGSNTNVGAGTIRTATSSVPSGWYCTNLASAAFGQDDEINSSYAARILNRLITGVDSGTRNGYLTTALATPGIISAIVVAAGDTDMLRDWDPIRQKHVFGCVDIYTRGVSFSEQDEVVAFEYQNSGTFGSPSTYITLGAFNKNTLSAQIPNFSTLSYPLYQGVQLLVTRSTGSTFYLGLTNAQFSNGFIILNPSDLAYQIVGDTISQASAPLILNGVPATNQAAIANLSTQSGNVTYQLLARYQSPLSDTPALQPIVSVNSVIGQPSQTGTVATNLINLVYTSDFLLSGGSNQAGDIVEVSTTATAPVTTTITALTGQFVTIASAMDVPVATNGAIGNVASVLSSDKSVLYGFGTDYTLAATGPYHTYGLQPLSVTCGITSVAVLNNTVTFYCTNKFMVSASVAISGLSIPTNPSLATLLNGQTYTVSGGDEATYFTATITNGTTSAQAPASGFASGYSIQNNQQLLVTYNQYTVNEKLTFISDENQTLTGTAPSILDNQGFVHNTWLPESYGNTTLTLDGAVSYNADGSVNVNTATGLIGAEIPHDSRYIKVTYNGTVMIENQDYVLTVDSVSGTAAIARSAANIETTRIPDGGTVVVSYFITEAFTFATEYPAFVEILANEINATKHAAADVLIKAMVANPVDITMTVVLQPNATADVADPLIRTAIDLVLDTAKGTLYQSDLITQVMGVTGVQSVNLPLVKCAKSDGSYDIGVVVPTGTSWIPLASDPLFCSKVNGGVSGTSPAVGETVVQTGTGATAIVVNVSSGILYIWSITGTANSTSTWVGQLSGGIFTPTSSPYGSLVTPANSFITSSPVLPDSTIPSGGEADAYVGLLYQGQAYTRTSSIQNFLASAATPTSLADSGSFYIIGTSDMLNSTTFFGSNYNQKVVLTIPSEITTPSVLSFFVTYQVFGEGSASDVTVSSTEYLTPGNITINYTITGS